MATILVVEDEQAIREMTCFILDQEGFDCLEAETAEEALKVMGKKDPTLILMDWMLPGISGIELTAELKSNPASRDIPIIMLTARGEEYDKVHGLENGADDYVTKPFSPRELIARINALLRRVAPHATEKPVVASGLKLDPQSHRVTCEGSKIDLGPTEFRLLHFFMTHADKVYSRAKLLDRVWGTNIYVEERTVDVHIRRLRKELEPHGADVMVQTVRGSGYRFSEQFSDS